MKISRESIKIERSAGQELKVDNHSEGQIVGSSFTIKSQTETFEQTKWSIDTSGNFTSIITNSLGNGVLLLISFLSRIL